MKKAKTYMPTGHLGTKRMGELAELAFMYRAASEDIGVARPYGDSHAYDFLVQHGRRLARVQVKSCFTKNRHGENGFTILARHRMSKRGGLAYSQEDVDFIAAYIAPSKTWYLIPIEALKGGMCIRLYPRLDPGRKTKRTGAFYEAYREAWHLLKQPEAAEIAQNQQNGADPESAATTPPPTSSTNSVPSCTTCRFRLSMLALTHTIKG